MPISTWRKLAVLLFASFVGCLAAPRTGTSADGIVRVDDLYCDGAYYGGPNYGVCASLCRKFRLHGIYAYRCCCSRYVMVPQSMAPYLGPSSYCPAPGAAPYTGAAPGYSTQGAYGYYNMYGAPPAYVPPAPAR